MNGELSQIIFYVEKNSKNADIWAFRTKTQEYDGQIWFTYLYYEPIEEEQNPNILLKSILENVKASVDEILLISDFSPVIEEAVLNNIACAAYILNSGENHREKDFPYADYCLMDIGDMEVDVLNKIWQRQRGIPWTILRTVRTLVREQILSDIDDLYEMYQDPKTCKYMENLYEDRKMEEEYLKEYIDKQYRFYEYGIWTIEDRTTGEYVGRAGISNREGYEEAELGYVIKESYRGKGYAKEVTKAIIDYAKEQLEMKDMIAFTLEENTASVRLLKSLGFDFYKMDNIGGKAHAMYRKKL